ncbi:N-acetyltransferase [Bdellovibrio sp. ZAP7]|uniref:GNAT family N-acetyltransferase n=1 Tax=Bdellovibrio sp. ZAP7 TaxID=2231053 RepID=UPI00115C2684|nr:GNAT family N-acetyltransferase [Bdellovibrio sp. ZAP7]QDK45104.1 N-acetyltransferase [Bdellovibrio sp. ZAP7]
MKLQIRKALKSDISTILNFIKLLADYEKLSHEVVATPQLLEEQIFGDKSPVQVLIAELDSKPVGFALYFYNFSTFLGRKGIYLEDLFVLPETRGQGVGKSLLQALAVQAVAEGCGRVEWSVLDWNKPAIDFYKSIGAGPMDEWTVYRLTGENLKAFAGGAK